MLGTFKKCYDQILADRLKNERIIMKFIFDYIPIIAFFVAYKIWGIYVATAVAMVASALQVVLYWLKFRQFEKMHIITLILIIFLGSSTLIFHEEIFIKWKPSVIYWVFSVVLLGSHWFGKKNLVNKMMGDKIDLPDKAWRTLNFSWAIFFFGLGWLNLYVVYFYSTNAWVNFKLFGTLGLIFIFVVLQAFYMAKFLKVDKPAHKKEDGDKL